MFYKGPVHRHDIPGCQHLLSFLTVPDMKCCQQCQLLTLINIDTGFTFSRNILIFFDSSDLF